MKSRPHESATQILDQAKIPLPNNVQRAALIIRRFREFLERDDMREVGSRQRASPADYEPGIKQVGLSSGRTGFRSYESMG